MDANANRTKGTPKSNSGRPIMPSSGRGIKGFLSEARLEMSRVTWPTPQETTRLTGVVLTVCGLVVALLFVLTIGVDAILNFIIKGGR